jgi:tristetraprolin
MPFLSLQDRIWEGIIWPGWRLLDTPRSVPFFRDQLLSENNLQHQRKGSASSITNAHHSLSGSDIDLSFSPSPPGTSGHSYSLSTSSDSATSITNAAPSSALSPAQPVPTRFNGHGHARTGSAGTLNWGSSFTSSGGSSSASRNSIHHPLSTSVGSTWVGELTARVGNEKTWA